MFHGQKAPAGVSNTKLRDSLAAACADERFEGKSGQAVVMSSNGLFPARRYIVVGLGKKEKFGPAILRDAVAIAARKAELARAGHFALTIPGEGTGKLGAADRVVGLVEGALRGPYTVEQGRNEHAMGA